MIMKRLLLILLSLLCGGYAASGQKTFSDGSDAVARQVDGIYVSGLRYLAAKQSEKGDFASLQYGSEPAVVGFAVIAMLAHGDDPNYGPYATHIRRGLGFILSEMNEQTGYIGRTMYNHGFATLALAEAYGAVNDARLGPALKKAVQLILDSQEGNPEGAWRYNPDSVDADTTVSGAQMVALFAARNAGIAVPEKAIEKGLDYFRKCQAAEGGFGYTNSSGPNAPRTAIGCLVMILAKKKNTEMYKKAFEFLESTPRSGHYHYYYLYYGAQTYFHHSPSAWRKWNQENIAALRTTQNADGSWEGQFGPVFSTSTALLSMALNYRFLPIYERQE